MSAEFSDVGNSSAFNAQDDTNNFNVSDMDNVEERTNIDYNNCYRMNTSVNKPIISVARRNERERKRVRLVNQGFAILRDRVPRDRCSRGRRSSKVETLRAAIMYIRQLQQLLLESQIRYQEQDMSACYTYIGDDSCLNSPVPSVCDNYIFNNGYQQGMFQTPPYSHLRSSSNTQFTNQVCDRHVSVPWFT